VEVMYHEIHYKPDQLGKLRGHHADTIREWFRD
jgi:hypothetical protein